VSPHCSESGHEGRTMKVGVTRFPGVGNDGRVFLRSVDDDFHTTNFDFEITITLTTGFCGAGAAFIELGRGEPSSLFYKEPRDGPHLYLRLCADDNPWQGSVSVIVEKDTRGHPPRRAILGDTHHEVGDTRGHPPRRGDTRGHPPRSK
jgi:hypothetical protein